MTSQKDYEEHLREVVAEIKRELNLISMHVRIENFYEGERILVEKDVAVQRPDFIVGPNPDDDALLELDEWAMDELFEYTGTGREHGDSAYFLEITSCDERPDLVGSTFEWGT